MLYVSLGHHQSLPYTFSRLATSPLHERCLLSIAHVIVAQLLAQILAYLVAMPPSGIATYQAM